METSDTWSQDCYPSPISIPGPASPVLKPWRPKPLKDSLAPSCGHEIPQDDCSTCYPHCKLFCWSTHDGPSSVIPGETIFTDGCSSCDMHYLEFSSIVSDEPCEDATAFYGHGEALEPRTPGRPHNDGNFQPLSPLSPLSPIGILVEAPDFFCSPALSPKQENDYKLPEIDVRYITAPTPSEAGSGTSSTGAVIGFGNTLNRALYTCQFPGCSAPGFQTNYLLQSHKNVHSMARPRFCPVPGCPRGVGGKGFRRKNEMIRHELVHHSPVYVCPFCPDQEHIYPRPDNLRRHVRIHHIDKDKDDPILRRVFTQPLRTSKVWKREKGGPSVVTGESWVEVKEDMPGYTEEKPGPRWFKLLTSSLSPPAPTSNSPLLATNPSYNAPECYFTNFSNQDDHIFGDGDQAITGDANQQALNAASNAEEGKSNGFPDNKPPIINEPEIPFTDSGYASALPAGRNSDAVTPDNLEDAESTEFGDSDEIRTVISAATTVVSSVAQLSISEVCNNIYDRIRQHVDEENSDLLFGALPSLIKAFAIQLAHLNSSDLNRRIMHFVYSHHQEIASQLRHMFHAENEDFNSCRKPQGGMTVAEKMHMWESRPREPSPDAINASELFQGVEDINDTPNHPELPLYSRAILQSEAYELFIDTLVKQSSFHRDESRAGIMVDKIRSQIMTSLPTGRISKALDPSIHEAVFQVPRQQFVSRLLLGGKRGSTVCRDICTASVLVSSHNDHVELTTVEEYIDKTWTNGGKALLSMIQSALDVKSIPTLLSEVSTGNAMASILILPDSFSIRVKGISYFIAEHGEQLAWLVAALQPPLDVKTAADSIPSITKDHLRDIPNWELGASVSTHEDATCLAVLKQHGWLENYVEPVIVRGFPTARRPSFFPGIEVSANLMIAITTWDRSSDSRGGVHLPGTGRDIEFVKIMQGVCHWHIVASEPCQCREERELLISRENIDRYRHVIDACPGPKNSPAKSIERRLPIGTPQQEVDTTCPSLDSVSPTTLTRTFSSVTHTPATSLDSDMLSIPDSPEFRPCHISYELSPIIDTVARQLLQGYREEFPATQLPSAEELDPQCQLEPTEDEGEGRSNQDTGASCSNTDSSTRQQRKSSSSNPKRARGNGGDDEGANRDDMPPPPHPKRSKRTRDTPAHKSLACPFWKLDHVKHRKCLKLEKFQEVNRVKQHLARSHTPIYCERCKTIFQDEAAHQRHLEEDSNSGSCMFKSWDERDGITRRQKDELHKKSKANLTESGQWFAVWGILFPSHPPPRSPYIDRGLSDDFCQFREYARDRGARLVLDALHAAGLFSSCSTNDEEEEQEENVESYRLEAVNRGLDLMFEDWLASRSSQSSESPSASDRRSNNSSARSDLSGNETVGSSFADSGVELSATSRLMATFSQPVDHQLESITPTFDGLFDQTHAMYLGGLTANNQEGIMPVGWPVSDINILGEPAGLGEVNMDALSWDFSWTASTKP